MTIPGITPPGGGVLRAGLCGLCLAGAALIWVPALAQAPGTGFATGYQANSGKPVDIEADTLEVDDKKKTAIFRGNVSATQGDVNLKSNIVHVSYTGGGTKTASAGASDAAAPFGGGGSDITQIKAEGNVFVTMKTKNQQVRSDVAVFDVITQKITVSGNVILSEGGNVIKGSKLVIDIKNGTSTVENTGSGIKNGRVGAVFTPKEKDKDKDKDKEKDKDGAN
jgi:lipopolysaccharide export system protein LptA